MYAATAAAARAGRRWRSLDPLLPRPGPLPPGCGVPLIAAGAGRPPSAVAACEHWHGEPGSLDLAWGAARRFRLTVLAAGPRPASGLDALLSRWRDHLADIRDAEGEDSAAVVTWPSRDVAGVPALLRHGLAPLAVVAARVTGRRAQLDRPVLPGGAVLAGNIVLPGEARAAVRIRRAGPSDVPAVVRLAMETIRFDAHFGAVTERPGTARALRAGASLALAGREPWIWLAEHDAGPAGMIWVQPPGAADWIAPMTSPAPAAYVLLLGVAAAARGRGVGAALAARAHHQIAAANVAVTLLHYALPSPLSPPFWAGQGYRPLWTEWHARPARTLR
jgi:ribosomal protein S18 acetylase RimI-like enzyme